MPKFRAWSKAEKIMSDVKKLDLCNGEIDARSFEETEIEEVELMQSTGLKDKNGKEIFEGDVVQYQNTKVPSADSKGVIRYFDNWAMFGIDIEHNEPRALFFNGLADHISLEVIGNIYENPELLE
nr:MAG TPA: YopX protein [Caudoviricetes sp.]